MYAVVVADRVQDLLAMDTAFVMDGHQYPANWLTHAAPAEREARGIYPVVQDPRPLARYAEVSRNPPVWDGEARVVRLTYRCHPYDLTTVRRYEHDAIARHARRLLAHSEPTILAAHDNACPVPPAWAAYRASVKAETARQQQALAAALDEAAIVAVLLTASWPTPPRSR